MLSLSSKQVPLSNDAKVLVGSISTNKNDSHNIINNRNTKISFLGCGLFVVVLVFVCNAVYYKMENIESIVEDSTTASSRTKTNYSTKKKRSKESQTVFQPALTVQSLKKMHQQFLLAANTFYETIQEHYGTQYYQNIFYFIYTNTYTNETKVISKGSVLFESGDPKSLLSKQRFKRKLKMKFIEASSVSKVSTSSATETKMTPFIWATGGHSSTAGHGNFYNESYTAYNHYGLQPIMAAMNINFISKNYAMGGTAAAPELALCTKEIYGIDYDILVWDFGMTDGAHTLWKQALFQYRANIHRQQQTKQDSSSKVRPIPSSQSNPIHLAFHTGGKSSGRSTLVQELEDGGLGILLSNDESILKSIEDSIPDSFGLSDIEIEELPEYIRNYKCGNQIENGDPYCQSDKYHLAQCPDRRYQTSWHPGWKWHAISGYLVTYYMISIMEETIQELFIELATKSALKIYEEFVIADRNDYEIFYNNASIPKLIADVLPMDNIDKFNLTHFVKGPNYCHTARLPADIRYNGILTETTNLTEFTSYDIGIGISDILNGKYDTNITNTSNEQILAYTEYERQVECPIPTNIDYKDYFYIKANSGWKQVRIPNHAEMNYYQPGSTTNPVTPLQGYVVMCIALCVWDRCPPGSLSRKVLNDEQLWTIRINGVNVTDMITIDNKECDILRHNDGFQFPIDPKKDNNTVLIEVQITTNSTFDPKSFTQISSWIVW